MRVFAGGCHCGNLEVSFATDRPPANLQVRRCACAFCARHSARAVTDPAGRLEITVKDAVALSRYRFALRTADFLICARCGVFVAAAMEHGGRMFATVNVNALDDRDAFGPGTPVSYEGEDATARIARRTARWTPANVRVATTLGAPAATARP